MYYCNYFRSEDPEEFDALDDISEQDVMDSPFYCPYYRQFSPPPPRPPFGQPGGPQGGGPPPPFGQPGGYQSGGAPSGPPPSITPSKQSAMFKSGPQTMAVEPRTLRPCLFRFVYIWPRRGRGFWAWLTYVGRRSASGFRWNGRRWVYFGIDLRQIDSFTCY
jgi:hypothetical protein